MKIRISYAGNDTQKVSVVLARIRKDFPKAAIKFKDADEGFSYVYIAIPSDK